MTETLDATRIADDLTIIAERKASTPWLSPRRWTIALAVIAVAGFALRVAYVFHTRHLSIGGDAFYYHQQANYLAQGRGFVEPFSYAKTGRAMPSAYHPPLWTLYLTLFSLAGLKSWTVHRLAGCLLGTSTIVLVGLLGRRIGGPKAGRTVGLVAAAIAAFYPFLWINDVLGMSESMVLLTCVGVMLLAYKLIERPTLIRAALLGGACALAALSRSEQILLLPLLVVPIIALLRKQGLRRQFALLTVSGLTAVVVLSPWVVRNIVTFDHPVFLSSNVEPTLVVSNCPTTFDPHSAFYAFWDIKCFSQTPLAGDESDQNVVWRHQALTFLSHHKSQAVGVGVARVGRMWNVFRPVENMHLDLIEDHPLWVSQSGLAVFAFLVPLALAGGVILRRRRIPLLPLTAFMIVVTATAVITYGATRFRAPAELSLVLLAAVAIEALATRTWPAPLRLASPPLPPSGPIDRVPSAGAVPAALATPSALAAPAAASAASAAPAALAAPASDKRDRFPCIDGYRALAALAVVGVHTAFDSGFTFVHSVGRFTARLDIGVAVFFLLSAFLLYRPFAAAHLAGRPGPAIRPYLRRRALRIVPAYWLALTVIAFVFHDTVIHGLSGVIVYYGFLQIYFRNYALGGISQAWSLCTEVTFYLFLPLWAGLIAWFRRTRTIDPRHALRLELYGVAALYLVGIASRVLLVYAVSRHWTNGEQWLSTLPPNLDLFALGMGLAIVSAWNAQRPVPSPAAEAAGRRPWAWWIAAGVAFWLVSTQCHLPRTLGPMDSTQYFWREVLYGLFALLLIVPGVFGAQDQGFIRRVLRNRVLVALGVISYGIYLWHQAIIAEFFKRNHLTPLHGHFKSMLAFTLIGAIVAATVSYFALEKPILRLKGKAR